MIRYKKRSLQQGGQSPASSYASGASAFQATNQAGASGAFKVGPVGPVVLPENRNKKSGRSSGGGGTGKQMFSNVMSQNLLKSKNLVNLTAMRNDELSREKKEMLDKYNANEDYFGSPAGLKRLNAYKDKQNQYANELISLENLYTEVSKGKNLNQVAIDQNNKVYVRALKTGEGLREGQITSISLKEYTKDLNSEESKYSKSLNIGQLLASIDDTNQYLGEDNNFTILLRQATAYNTSNSEDVTKFILSNVKNTVGKVTPTVKGIVFSDGSTQLSNKEMDDYVPGSNEIIDELVNQQINGNGNVRKNAAQQILTNKNFDADIKSSSNPDQFFEDEIKKQIWTIVRSGLKMDGKSAEEIAADGEILNDVSQVMVNNKWIAADTGFYGNAEKIEFEGFITEYESNGTKVEKKKSNKENVLTTTSTLISNTGSDINKEFHELTSGDNPIRKKEDLSLKDFTTIATYGNIEKATFADGVLVSQSPLATKQGLLPVDSADVRSVTLPTTTDSKGNEKLATWAMDVMSAVQDRYQELYQEIEVKISSNDLALFTKEEKADNDIEPKEINRAISEQLGKEYMTLMEPIFSGPNYSEDIPKSYTQLMKKKFRLKQFYQMEVVGEMKDDYEDMSIAKFISPNLEEREEMSVKKYGMQTNVTWRVPDYNTTTIKTTIFIPQHYTLENVDFKKAAKYVGEKLRKGSDFLNWNDLLDNMSSQHGFDQSIKEEEYSK